MSRDYLLYIEDIIESISKIENFVGDMRYEDFVADEKTSSAVIRHLEIIGEASKHVPDFIREKYSDIPWADMARMRDKIIHFYFGVDYDIVWKVVKNRLPEIQQQLRRVVSELKAT